MGYIEDLRDKRLLEFSEELKMKMETSSDEEIFNGDFSIYSFSCTIKNGLELIKLLNKAIRAGKQFVKRYKSCLKNLYKTFKTKIINDSELPKATKKELKEKIKKICKNDLKEKKQKLAHLQRLRIDLLFRTCNVVLYIFTVLFSVGCGALLYLFDNIVVKSTIYPISALIVTAFVALQVIYVVKYLKAVKADIRGSILYSIKRAYSTALVVWWYFAVLCLVNRWDPQILLYAFIAIFVLFIIFMIYDMFLSSSFFDEVESVVSLIAATLIGLFFFADSFGNLFISQIGSWFMLLSCGLLTLLVVKKFLLDRRGVKGILEVFYIFIIIVTTIALTIFALYKLFWQAPVDGQTADNTLFSAVVGVYAALLGGGLTLTGVAWTIKHNENQRKEEERKKYRPFMELQEEIPARMVHASKLKGINCNDPKYVKDGEAHIFSTSIKEFNIKNISESNIILEGVVLDNEYCAFDHIAIVAKGEAIQIQTTRNFMLSLGSADVSMDLIVSDVLGNKYKINCVLEKFSEHAGMLVAEQTDSKAIYFPQLFYVVAISLPILMGEVTNE